MISKGRVIGGRKKISDLLSNAGVDVIVDESPELAFSLL